MVRTSSTETALIAGQELVASNNFTNMNEVRAAFTVDNAGGTAALVEGVYPLVGAGLASARTLPSGVTYSGDFATFADYLEYMTLNRMLIIGIRLETTDTANYTGNKLTLGTRLPNNRNPKERDLNLSDYKETAGSVIDTTLNIRQNALDKGFLSGPKTYAKFGTLKKNTTTTVYWLVSHIDTKVPVQPVDF